MYHNTLWQVQQRTQSAILLNSYTHIDAPGAPTIGCANVSLSNNILVKSPSARAGPVFQVRRLPCPLIRPLFTLSPGA